MRKTFLGLIILILCCQPAFADTPDFGPDGLKGLSESQIAELNQGKLIFSTSDDGNEESSLIESVAIFNKTPQQTWDLLVQTHRQVEYLKELAETKIIKKEDDEDIIYFKLKSVITINYQVEHEFDYDKLYIHWELDDDYANELDDLRGFWRLYPYDGGQKTLVRYGSSVTLRGVPDFVQNMFKKGGVGKSLKTVRKWVESDGTYHK